MASSRLNAPLLLISAACILFIPTDATSPDISIPGMEGRVLLPLRRSAAEVPASPHGDLISNTSLVLASERTKRRDPLNDFKRYTGGWNISNRHYWASVGFTAAPLFAIAAAWFAVFGMILIISSCYFCCCRRPMHSYSSTAYAISLILLLLFTLAAIIGCVLLYYGQEKFHKSSSDTLDYVVSQANFTVDNLREVSGNLSAAKRIEVINMVLPAGILARIDEVLKKVNTSADDLDRTAADNAKNIRDVLNTVRLVLIIVAAVMLLLALLGFIFSIFGLQIVVYILVFVGLFLVTAMFILSGVSLLLHNAVGDTCVAMDEWVSHPTAHTALDDILPCVNAATANESLSRSREVVVQLVGILNNFTDQVANPDNPSIRFNQSGPLMPTLCSPFNLDLSNRSCASVEVTLSNASQVWKKFVCNTTTVNGFEICKTVGRITPTIYDQMNAAAGVGFALYYYSPFLVELEDCTFVRRTFSAVDRNDCPGLRKYTNWVFAGLTLVSAAVMLSTIFWVVYARERRHRVYGRQAPVPAKPR